MKTRTETIIEVSDWNKLVKKTYGKPYHFQQQEGCKERGVHHFSVPEEGDDFENDSIPEEVNGEKMGVSFEAWKARDPKAHLNEELGDRDWSIELFWHRNFYPDFQTLANDLHERGLLEAGDYTINIDW